VTKPDEKFSDIVRWYTGHAGNHKTIAKANADIDPESLVVGNEIYIPATLLKTRKPMYPKSYQTSIAGPAKKSPATRVTAPAPSASKPNKLQLFGPKQLPAH
jgi:hypothetical protein